MTDDKFMHLMMRARTMDHVGLESAEYWRGYERGLRRTFHGERFGTDEEHGRWTERSDELGRGYHDGLLGQE